MENPTRLPTHIWQALEEEPVLQQIFTIGTRIWCRANFRCEYCGFDFLRDPWAFAAARGDHILPQTIYPNLAQDLNNLANACCLCNGLKRDWDPTLNDNECANFFGLPALPVELRNRLIWRCQAHLYPMREHRQQQNIEPVLRILRMHLVR